MMDSSVRQHVSHFQVCQTKNVPKMIRTHCSSKEADFADPPDVGLGRNFILFPNKVVASRKFDLGKVSMVARRYCSTTLAIHHINTKEVKSESQIGGNYLPTGIHLTVISVQPNFVHASDLDLFILELRTSSCSQSIQYALSRVCKK